MEKKSLQQVPSAVREAYTKAQKARGGEQISIELFKAIVQKEPAFFAAREKLRKLEISKARMANPVSKAIGTLMGSFAVMAAKGLVAKKPLEALAKCEEALAKNVDNPVALQIMAEAAEKLDAKFIAVEAYSIIREFHPDNEGNIRALVEAMQKNNQAREAVAIFKELAAVYPDDIEVQSELRAAMALASIEKGNWEESGSAQDKAEDSSGNVIQQLLDGTIHDEAQARQVISHLSAELANGESVEIRRKLAEAYMLLRDYDKAIAEYEKVATSLGTLDPFIDKQIEAAVVSRFNDAVNELKNNPGAYDDPEKQIAEFTAQCNEYTLERAKERVRIYPNDTQLNYDLGVKLFENGRITDAIACFQNAGRNPQRRSECLAYLGRCFAVNGQFDMAVEQFNSALQSMDPGDRRRFDVKYDLAAALEQNGHEDEAIEAYKEIYQRQANFKDVAVKIQSYYDRKNQNKQV